MALKIRPAITENFTGTGNSTICTLSNIPNEIMRVLVDDVESKNYTFSNNKVTINSTNGAIIKITYNYWMELSDVDTPNKQDIINVSGILKGNGSGSITSAVAGMDYVVPSGNVESANTLNTNAGNSNTPVYFSNGIPVACTSLSLNTTGSAATLTTPRTIQTNLGITTAASFNGSANVTPGITGTLPVANGGTGNSSVDTTPTNGSTKMVTSDGVYTALAGKANSSHNQAASTISAGTLGGQVLANASAVTTLGTAQIRNIYAGTSDMTAGTSTLKAGDIYIVYEN